MTSPAAQAPPPPAAAPAPRGGDAVVSGPAAIRSATGLWARFAGPLTATGRLESCWLDVCGPLTAPAASIVGGRLTSVGTITIGTLGDAQGTPTQVTLGVAAEPPAPLANARRTFEEESAALQRTRVGIAALEAGRGDFSHTEREELTLAMFDLPDLEAGLGRLQELLTQAASRPDLSPVTEVELTVTSMLHRGVEISVHGTGQTWTATQDLKGPIVIALDEGGTLVTVPEAGSPMTLAPAPGRGQEPATPAGGGVFGLESKA